jgi:cytidylate kinase
MSLIIAIDGPAASGKGTLSRKLADYYQINHLDTGLLYRAVAHSLMANHTTQDFEQEALAVARNLDPERFNEVQLRQIGVGELASRVAAVPKVRQALLQLQRNFATNGPGAVLDGRDIGTIVLPDADAKLFVTASEDVRARRRHTQECQHNPERTLADVLDDIRRRDARDSARAAAPMKPARDALLLDTTSMSIETAFKAAIAMIDQCLTHKKHCRAV